MQVISTDSIMMMLHYSNKDLKIDVNQSDSTVSRALEPYLEGLITSLSNSKKNSLIEGVHIQPEFADHMMTKFPNKIQCVFLGYKEINPKIKLKQLKEHADMIDNPWYIHMKDDELLHLTTYLQKESELLFTACQKFSKTYIEVKDIMKDKNEIIKTLLSDV
jgi:hypothetical protein